MSGYPYFVIVGREDKPIYEEWFDPRYLTTSVPRIDEDRWKYQYVAGVAELMQVIQYT